MLTLGWFSTGRGEGSRNLFITIYTAIVSGELDANIQFVFCNRQKGEAEGSDRFIEMVENLGIPIVTFSSRKFRKGWTGDLSLMREVYDLQVMNRLRGFRPALCVLAGYVRIVSREMCLRYKMINLHPAAPEGPTGTWQEVIWQLIRERATHSGIRIHLVTEELDQGPILTYCTYPIRGGGMDALWDEVSHVSVEVLRDQQGEEQPLFKAIRQRGARRELPLILETLKAITAGSINVNLLRPPRPIDLTERVEEALKKKGEPN